MGRIVTNREILGGKPIIKGTRISVEFILELLSSGVTEDEILQDYPHLTKDDIHPSGICLIHLARMKYLLSWKLLNEIQFRKDFSG